MAISAVKLYVAFTKLFKTTEPDKQSVMQYGVMERDFDAVDRDLNEYLGVEEALQNHSISELLYSNMVSTYGSADADEAEKNAEKSSKKSSLVESIDPSRVVGSNPFI